MTPLILVTRGSRDPSTAQSVWALARRVAAMRAGSRVRSAFLDFEVPDLRAALAKEVALAHRRTVVVPLLLSTGYTAGVRIPTELESAGASRHPLTVFLADVLGPVAGHGPDLRALDLVLGALLRRLAEAGIVFGGRHSSFAAGAGPVVGRPDALVLAAAGSRATRAMQASEHVARALATAAGVPVQVAYTSIGTPTIAQAVAALRERGAGYVATATYLVAPGTRHHRVVAASRCQGGAAISAPLGDAPEVAELVWHRADATAA